MNVPISCGSAEPFAEFRGTPRKPSRFPESLGLFDELRHATEARGCALRILT